MIDPAELEERRLTAALNRKRAERRRELYRIDPLWRLSKLKQNREDRLRTKARQQPSADRQRQHGPGSAMRVDETGGEQQRANS